MKVKDLWHQSFGFKKALICTRNIYVLVTLFGYVFSSACAWSEEIPIPQSKPLLFIHPSQEKSSKRKGKLQGIRMTLEDAIFLGLRNNKVIRSSYVNRISEKFDLRVAEDQFSPHFVIAGELSRVRIGNSPQTMLDIAPEVNVLTQSGGEFRFIWNNSASLDRDSDGFSSSISLSFEQPLLRGGGVEVGTAALRNARLTEQVNRLRLRATISETVTSIIFAYRQLLAAQEQLNLAEDALMRAEELLSINNALIAAGRMADVEKVQTEADIENLRLNLLQVKQQVSSSRLSLLMLIGVDLGAQIVAVESLNINKVDTNIQRLMQIALSQRPDYMGQIFVLEQRRLGLTVAENQQLWDISMFMNAKIGRSMGAERTLSTIKDGSIGLRFSVPVNDMSRKRELVNASASLQSAEIQLEMIRNEIESQIRLSSSEISYLWEQIEVGAKSRHLAAQAIEVAKAKLNAGRSTTFEIRYLEEGLRSSEINLLNSKINYLNALTRLDLQVGSTPETWRLGLLD